MKMEVAQLSEKLALGSIPDTELVCFTYSDPALSANLMFAMDSDDLTTLKSLLMETLLLDLKPGERVDVGRLPGRPLGLILHYGCHLEGHKLLLVELHQRDHSFTAPLPGESITSLLELVSQKLEQARPLPEVEGEVVSTDGPLVVRTSEGRTETFERVDGISHIWGVWNEFLQPQELAAGTRVRVKPVQLGPDQRAYLRARLALERLAAPESEAYRTGQEKDALMLSGEVYGARSGMLALLGKTQGDGFALAKATLSILLGYVQVGDTRAAHALWLGKFPMAPLNQGIKLIERGVLSERDTLLYKLISAQFHSLNPNATQALAAVNGEMGLVTKHSKDPALTALALRNWRLQLNEVFDGKPVPPAALAPWESQARRYGGPVLPKIPCYPAPDSWTPPTRPAAPAARGCGKAATGAALVALFCLVGVAKTLFFSGPSVYRFDHSAFNLYAGMDSCVLTVEASQGRASYSVTNPCKPWHREERRNGQLYISEGSSNQRTGELDHQQLERLLDYLASQDLFLQTGPQQEPPKPYGWVRIVCPPAPLVRYLEPGELEAILAKAPTVGPDVQKGISEAREAEPCEAEAP